MLVEFNSENIKVVVNYVDKGELRTEFFSFQHIDNAIEFYSEYIANDRRKDRWDISISIMVGMGCLASTTLNVYVIHNGDFDKFVQYLDDQIPNYWPWLHNSRIHESQLRNAAIRLFNYLTSGKGWITYSQDSMKDVPRRKVTILATPNYIYEDIQTDRPLPYYTIRQHLFYSILATTFFILDVLHGEKRGEIFNALGEDVFAEVIGDLNIPLPEQKKAEGEEKATQLTDGDLYDLRQFLCNHHFSSQYPTIWKKVRLLEGVE